MKSKLEINKYGTKRWKLPGGDLHREDGPAVEWINGHKEWWLNGKRHREDGSAIEFYDGDKVWYLNNIKYSEQEYKKKLRLIKLEHIL